MIETPSRLLAREYRSTALRAPSQPLVLRRGAQAIGQRIVVQGRVLDSDGRPVPHTRVVLWQANAIGRYAHVVDNWPAPLDHGFTGTGRTVTDAEGRYTFTTTTPGGRRTFTSHCSAPPSRSGW